MKPNCFIIYSQKYCFNYNMNKKYTKKNDNKAEPFMIGNGELDYVCSQCNHALAETLPRAKFL